MAPSGGGVRQGGGEWRTTQEAAWTLMGLTEVVRTKEKDTPEYQATVSLGDGKLFEQKFSGASMPGEKSEQHMKDLLATSAGWADEDGVLVSSQPLCWFGARSLLRPATLREIWEQVGRAREVVVYCPGTFSRVVGPLALLRRRKLAAVVVDAAATGDRTLAL